MIQYTRTCKESASMSARSPKTGPEPDPIVATRPVFATGHVYSIPSRSSSDRINSLVFTSWKANSGHWWSFLRVDTSQSVNSALCARSSKEIDMDVERTGVGIGIARKKREMRKREKVRNGNTIGMERLSELLVKSKLRAVVKFDRLRGVCAKLAILFYL